METTYNEPDIVQFGENITYTCLVGHYFDEDFDMKNYSVQCYTNGSITELPWKNCIHPKSEIITTAIVTPLIIS